MIQGDMRDTGPPYTQINRQLCTQVKSWVVRSCTRYTSAMTLATTPLFPVPVSP